MYGHPDRAQWVLTAKHCFTDTGFTAETSFVQIGSLVFNAGEYHTETDVYMHPVDDAALVHLTLPVGDNGWVVPYGV